ncbi:hypothetical protein V5799_015795 [Amblyomma americanum]|uniref:RING-type domain-containing protein n=1 Tax=Amblyomma americanum TaxID=6943 RepID=A0AAQ4F6Y4_AMBAM
MPPGSSQYTLVGFSPELDWRPLRFVKPIPPNRLCSACGLVRKRTAWLPCMHVLCDSCYEQSGQEGLHVCPLDGYECPDEDDVDWKDIPAEHLLKREVRCWNEELWDEFDASLSSLQGNQDPKAQAVVEADKYLNEPYWNRMNDPLKW